MTPQELAQIEAENEMIEAELVALNIPDGDASIEHPDTQFSDFDSSNE